jgi:hypothetical protein
MYMLPHSVGVVTCMGFKMINVFTRLFCYFVCNKTAFVLEHISRADNDDDNQGSISSTIWRKTQIHQYTEFRAKAAIKFRRQNCMKPENTKHTGTYTIPLSTS